MLVLPIPSELHLNKLFKSGEKKFGEDSFYFLTKKVKNVFTEVND